MTNGYIGSYTKKNGKGIYRFELNENQSRIDLLETGFELEASTYLVRNNEVFIWNQQRRRTMRCCKFEKLMTMVNCIY